MNSLSLRWATGLVALFFFFPAFADPGVAGPPRQFVFPGSNIGLQNGDIILSNSGGLFSALNRQYGFPRGPYSHASVYIEDSKTGGVLVDFSGNGLIELSPDLSAQLSDELALIRPRIAPPAGALSAALRQLKSRPLQFDYDMRWPDVGSDATYCAGVVSQLYRLAGMPDPFPPGNANEARGGFMSHWATERLGLDLNGIVSPNRILSLGDFELLAEYKPADLAASLPRIITMTAVQKVNDYMEKDGLSLQPPKPGSRFILSLANTGLLDGLPLSQIPEKRRGTFITLNEFVEKVRMRTSRYLRHHDEIARNEQAVVEVTQAVADQYRDIYFAPVNSAPKL